MTENVVYPYQMILLQIGDFIIQPERFIGITVSTSNGDNEKQIDTYEASIEWGTTVKAVVLHSYEYRGDDHDYDQQKRLALSKIKQVKN